MRKNIRLNLVLSIVFLASSLIYVWSFAHLGVIFGSGDFVFHAHRMEELLKDLQGGVLIPRISTYSFNNVGSGINFFYPWIFLYPFVIFQLLTHNPVTAYYLGIVLETFLTFVIAYYAMNRYSHSKIRAFSFSIVYTLANYRLYLVFNQNVLAESLAYTFIPLVLIGFYEVFFRNKQAWPLLAIGMTMLIYSHMLTTALTATLMLVILVIFWKVINNKRERLIAAVKAALLSFALSAFYLVPFFYQALNNKLKASWVGLLFIKTPMETIQTSLDNDPTQTIGLFLLITISFGFLTWRKADSVDKSSYIFGLILVILTTTLIPWDKFASTPIANLQFPYRLNGLATVMLSIYLSRMLQILVINCKKHNISKYLILSGIVLVPLLVTYSAEQTIITSRTNIPYLTRPSTVKHYYLGMHSSSYNLTKSDWNNMFYYYGHNGSFDYFPVSLDSDNLTNVVTHHALVNNKLVSFASRRTSKPNEIIYNLKGIKAGSKVELPILYYKNDLVKIGNGKYQTPKVTKNSTITITVPKENKVVSVKYHNSWLDNLSLLVTLISWLVVVFVYFKNKIKAAGR